MSPRIRSIHLVAGIFLATTVLAAGPAPLAAQFPTEPPPPTELRALQFPGFQEATLPNGLTILVVENNRLPVVSMRLSMRAGSRDDPAGLEGLAGIVGELMTKGTARRTAEQIAEEIEGVGASLFAGAGSDFFAISTTVLKDHVGLAFDLMSDVVLHSTYLESELELARTRMLSGLQVEKSDPGALATRYFNQTVYGDHPYGRQMSETSVRAMTQGAVADWATAHLKPGGSLLVLSGDISLAEGRRLAERHLGAWTGSPPSSQHAAPPAARPTEILLVHRPGSDQANIRVGNLALEAGDDAYYAAVVTNRVLGGGSDARLFNILREQRSWTYGAYSSVVRRKNVGYFQANTEVRTSVTDSALVEILTQIDRIRTEAVPEEELAAAKGYLVGSFPLSIETPQQIAGQVATVKLLGLGEDYLRTYHQRLNAVAADDVMQAAHKITAPDSAVVVVVGDGQALYDRLSAIAPVRIIDVEGVPLTPDELMPTAAALVIDPAHLEARRDSFQVLVQGNPMGSQVTEISRSNGALTYRESVAIAALGMTQEATLSMDLDPVTMGTVDAVMEMGGQRAETHLEYADGRVRGQAQTPGPGGAIQTLSIDTTLIDGVIDDRAITVVLQAMPLAEGARFTLNVFQSSEGSVAPISVSVARVEEVTVPAGTFTAFRVEVSGGEAPFVMHVTQDTPRRIVKIELVGQPIVIVLVQ